jgi:hypothetical protein
MILLNMESETSNHYEARNATRHVTALSRDVSWKTNYLHCPFTMCCKQIYIFGFEALTAMPMTSTVLWIVRPCTSEIARRFGRKYRLHLRSPRVRYARNQQKQAEN